MPADESAQISPLILQAYTVLSAPTAGDDSIASEPTCAHNSEPVESSAYSLKSAQPNTITPVDKSAADESM